jgi:hypothetical protein
MYYSPTLTGVFGDIDILSKQLNSGIPSISKISKVRFSGSESFAERKKGTFTGKLATVKKDGNSHVVPIWFIL